MIYIIMGNNSSSKSSAKQSLTNKVVNKSTLNYLNSNTTKVVVNTTVNNAKTCSAALISSQSIILQNVTAQGNIDLNLNQTAQGSLSFSCVQTDEVQSDIVTNVINQIMADLSNSYDNSSISNLNALANAKSENQFAAFPFGGTKSDANTDQKVKNNIKNSTTRNLQNVVSYSVNSTLTVNNISNCLSKVISTQTIVVGNLTSKAGNINVVANQAQAISLYTSCVQSSGVSQQITQDLTDFFGLQVHDDTKNALSNVLSSEALSEAVNQGPLGAVGSLFSGLFSPFTNLLGSLSGLGSSASGLVSCSLSFSCLCCLILCIISVLAFVYNRFSGGSDVNKLEIATST